eukprot:5103445-Prymnesium_polylepis.1
MATRHPAPVRLVPSHRFDRARFCWRSTGVGRLDAASWSASSCSSWATVAVATVALGVETVATSRTLLDV